MTNYYQLGTAGALLVLQALPHGVLYSSMVWKFSVGSTAGRQQQQQLPYHRFRQGDSLLITRFSEGQAQVGVI
jgi:hypothetical protein